MTTTSAILTNLFSRLGIKPALIGLSSPSYTVYLGKDGSVPDVCPEPDGGRTPLNAAMSRLPPELNGKGLNFYFVREAYDEQ
jgi:hypothetical protein